MQASQSMAFAFVYISWGIITVILIVLLSYRATLWRDDEPISTDDTLDLERLQRQQTLLSKRSMLMGEIIVLSVISGVLLLTCVGFSLFRTNF